MDGTSTTTEPLALHALEYMVRRFTGRMTKAEWAGLDPIADYPHVIGNSNVRHTEFLLERYRNDLKESALAGAFIEALAWTLACMEDSTRRRTIWHDAKQCGLGDLLKDADFQQLFKGGDIDDANVASRIEPFVRKHGMWFHCSHSGPLTAAALDIYYMRYHAILRAIEQGRGATLSRELLSMSDRRLIEPMPGYDLFVPLVKGWLDPRQDDLFAWLAQQPDLATTPEQLARLAQRFREHPAKLALVTASIRYEAETTMREVMSIVAERVKAWPMPEIERDELARRVADVDAVFDAFICAADACEHRLKPHPDLYCLALERMSIPKSDYRYCVGLEDTEPGIIALRAAGVGCAVALPNHDTNRQDYRAACLQVRGGLPDLIGQHNLLLQPESNRT